MFYISVLDHNMCLQSSRIFPNPNTYFLFVSIDSTNCASPLHRRIWQSSSLNSGPAGSRPIKGNAMNKFKYIQ